jgi:hypothetical protein
VKNQGRHVGLVATTWDQVLADARDLLSAINLSQRKSHEAQP